MNDTRIFILRHPSETGQAKNTVPLLQLSLTNIEVLDGEQEEDFRQIKDWCINNKAHVAVLYPNENSHNLAAVSSENIHSPATLLLIDGTWRKAYKIWQLNPWLHQLRSFHLQDMATIYQRRSRRGNGLSTLEATAEALKLLEDVETQPLIDLLKARQLYTGRE